MFTDNTTQIFNVIIRFLFLKYHYLYPEEKNCLELKIGHFNAAQKKHSYLKPFAKNYLPRHH